MIFTDNDKRCTPYVLDEAKMDNINRINELDIEITYKEAYRDALIDILEAVLRVDDLTYENLNKVVEALSDGNDLLLNEELLKQAK